MARYAVKENPEYTHEKSTGGMIMNVPRPAKYSVIDTEDGDRLILHVVDSVKDPQQLATLLCSKLNG